MELKSLRLQNFRNYADESFHFDSESNIIFGENAQGKTNLLEAIAYLASGESPRTRSERELLRFGEQEASLTAESLSRGREFKTEILFRSGEKKKMTVNGVKLKRTAQLGEVLSCVYFCPDDLQLIRLGAAERRQFLNSALKQLLPRYGEALQEYRRAYEQKMRILKDFSEDAAFTALLPEFNDALAKHGAVLIHYRARYIAALSRHAEEIHLECSGGREKLSLRYETVSGIADPFAPPEELYIQLKEHLALRSKAELAAKLCLSGPHKDDIAIAINGENARAFGSQGQARTAALALKLSERELLKETKEEYPLLLLDDVLSELDAKRQDFVLNRIRGGQVFISCCEDERLSTLLSGKVFHVKQGRSEA